MRRVAARLVCLSGRSRLTAPRPWRHADHVLEGTAKSGLRFVANVFGNRSDAPDTTAEQSAGYLHPPVRKILHWRLADKEQKAFGE
jgi:hypothetical protein